MSGDKLNLVVLVGSVREGRFGPVVADWFTGRAAEHGAFSVELVDLAEYDVPTALPATPPAMHPELPRPDRMAGLTAKLAAADAVVVLTPDYNRSFPASLKAAIDWYHREWAAKAIGFVGYSGATGGVLAIEQLRQVFGELNAHTVREYVSFPRFYELFAADGTLHAPEGPEAAAKSMLDQLAWWGSVLHDARRDRPFGA